MKRRTTRTRCGILGWGWLAAALLLFAPPAIAQTFGTTAALNPNAGGDSGSDAGPHVVSDGDGNWLAVWTSNENFGGAGTDFDIFWSMSSDDGATWTSVGLLNSNATSDSGNDVSPQAATNENGYWIVVWHSNEDLGSTAGVDDDIFYTVTANGGTSWSAVATLNPNADSDGSDSDVNPSLVSDGSTVGWTAAWESDSTLGATIGSDLDILVASSSDRGVSWFGLTALNTNAATDTGDDIDVELATDFDENVVAVWYSEEDLGGNLGTDWDALVSRSSDTGQTWTAPAALNTNAASDTGVDVLPQVSCDRNGTWLAVWSSNDSFGSTLGDDVDVMMARSIDVGATWTAPTAVNSNAATDGLSHADNGPYVAGDGAGNWVVTWITNGDHSGLGSDFDILYATSDDDGATWTPFAALNSNATTDSLDDANARPATDRQGNWIAAWDSYDDLGATVGTDRDIHLSLGTGPDADGDGLSDGAEVNLYGSDPSLTNTDGDAFDDSVEVAGGSNPADSKSTPLNSLDFNFPTVLNSYADTDSGTDAAVKMAGDGDGIWVAAWTSLSDVAGTGTDYDIFVSRSTDDGETWAAASVLHAYGTSDAESDTNPNVAADGEGNWVIAWNSRYDLGSAIGTDPDVLVVTSDDDGETWSTPAALNTTAATDTAESDSIHGVLYDGSFSWLALMITTNDLSGTIQSDTDVVIAISSDDGVTWGTPLPVSSDAATDGADDVVPRFARDGSGGWIVVWHRWDLFSSLYNIMIASSTFPSLFWNPVATLNSNVDTGNNANPRIASDGNGKWIAVWRSSDDLSGTIGSDFDIFYAESTDLGANWTPAAALNSDATTDSREDSVPWIAADGADNWIVTYNGLESHSGDDGATWTDTTPFIPSYAPAGSELVIETDRAGNWVAVWGSSDSLGGTIGADVDILSSRAFGPDRDGDGYADGDEVNTYGANPDDASGTPQPKIAWDAPAALNTNAASDGPAPLESDVRIAYDSAGTWLAVWSSQEDLGAGLGSDFDILYATSDDDGTTWSAPAALNTNAATDSGDDLDPSIFGGGGLAHVVWNSTEDLGSAIGTDPDILYSQTSNQGASWSAPVHINSNATTDSATDTQARISGSLLDVLVVWESNDSLGSTIGTDIDILRTDSQDLGANWSPAAALNDFAAIDSHPDQQPEIAAGSAVIFSNFTVVWQSDYPVGSTGTDADILIAHSIDAGASWNSAVGLNATMSSDNPATDVDFSPDIAYDGNGNWMVVWRSTNDLGGTIGTDNDILFSSSAAPFSWSASAALNTNAATGSAGNAVEPRIDAAAASSGVWVATWNSDTDFTGSLGSDYDIIEAHTPDHGLHWTDPAPLASNAATDSGFDGFPEVATSGFGDWIAVWTSTDALGATIGSDPDLLFSTGWGPDQDGDGLADGWEAALTSNVRGYDSDGDGWSDGFENDFGTGVIDPDHDDDGTCDGPGSAPLVCTQGPDNCPFSGNPGQTNSDALFAGDDCQCGDISDNGIVDMADVTAAQQNLVGATVTGTPDFSRCNVVGPVDELPPYDDCTVLDVFRIRRYVEGGGTEPELIEDVCAAYRDLGP